MAGWNGRHGPGMTRKPTHRWWQLALTRIALGNTSGSQRVVVGQWRRRRGWNGRMEWTPWSRNDQETDSSMVATRADAHRLGKHVWIAESSGGAMAPTQRMEWQDGMDAMVPE